MLMLYFTAVIQLLVEQTNPLLLTIPELMGKRTILVCHAPAQGYNYKTETRHLAYN
jgi:hypothetical protein